eukprot:5479247-Prymnesium_polylepis.1
MPACVGNPLAPDRSKPPSPHPPTKKERTVHRLPRCRRQPSPSLTRRESEGAPAPLPRTSRLTRHV